MAPIDWKNELKRMLDVIEKESTESLDKISQQVGGELDLPFNDAFRKNVLEMVQLRLESRFTEIVLENWNKRHSTVRIFVKTMSNYKLTIEIKLSDNVEILKEKIHEKEGSPPDLQRLRHEGDLLEDGRSLLHYNIQKGSTLELYLRMCGC